MKNKTNIINNVITYAVLLGLLIFIIILCNQRFGGNSGATIGLLIAGALITSLINAFVHEFGHVIAGKFNKFSLISFTVWFFNWKKVDGKIKFSFAPLGNEAGYTEMLSESTDNLSKRFARLSLGGIIASFIMTVVGGVLLFFIDYVPYEVFCLVAMTLPISAYYFVGSLLPMKEEGVYNDGGIFFGILNNDDVARVIVSTLAIQCQMFSGKTPSEVDEKYYFDLPQLPEDDVNFIVLLNYRYLYYLDKGDYENAKKINLRVEGLMEYLLKSMQPIFKSEMLYQACTFDFDEDKADELMYECENYLNKINTATNIRIKMAYLKYVVGDTEALDEFYKKGLKEVERTPIKGYGAFEKKLLDEILNQDKNVVTSQN